MAKQIDHMDGASMITLLRFAAGVSAALGFVAAGFLLYHGDQNAPPFLGAAIMVISGLISWVMLSVFAYMAQCVGRLAMHADEAARSTQDD